MQVNTKRMKAAVAISRAYDPDLRSKDEKIASLQQELTEVKAQFFKEAS